MSNILRPNFFGIETTATPEWVVSSGMVAKVTDASGDQTVVIAQGGKLDLDGALGANLIVLQGLSSTQVSVYRSGTEARFKLLSTGETFLSLPSTSTAQTMRFTDGDKSLQIVSGAPRFAGTNIATETAAPGLTSVGVVGSELQLRFNEEMSGGSLPLASAFQIVVNGVTLTSTEYTVAGAEGDTVRINLPASVGTAATISVSYSDPTTSNDTRALQDINSNDVASFGPQTAVRNPADVRPPILLAAATSTDGSKVTLEFNEDLAGDTLAASRFAVTVAGNGVGVTGVSVQSKFVELSLSSGLIAAGQAVQLSYTGAGGSADALRDAAGNAVSTWAAWNVSNEVLTAAPVLAKATNILKPNLYGIETAQTPNWKVSAGMVAKVTDASGNQVITVARGGKLDLDGAVGSNVIVLEGRSSGEVEVYRSGTEVRFRLLESGETILSMPATSTAQTVRFVNGDKILQIVTGSPRFDGVAVATDSTAPVHDRATIAGTDLRVYFSEELDGAKLPAASTLTITVNGQVLTASQFTIQGVEGKQLVVALAQAEAEGAVVTVAYADPTTGNDPLALQDINGNDAASFGPIQAVEPVKKVLLDDQVPAGGPGNPVSLTVSSQAFHLVEDFARTSNFEIVGFGADDKIELTNLQIPAALSISTIESDVEVIVNAGGGVTSTLLLKGIVPSGVSVYNPATFNDLAVGDLIGIDATRPVFTGGTSRTVSVVEGQAQLVTVGATDASAVSYTLSGADAALLQVSGGGAVSLKSGVLDYDAVGAKRTYSFDVLAIDVFGNDRIQAVTVNVTNDPADDAPPTGLVSIQSLSSPSAIEGAKSVYTVTLSAAAPAGGVIFDWQVVAGSVGDPAEAQDFGTGASSAFPSGSITIAAGQTTGAIEVDVFDDSLVEGVETFQMQVGKLTAGTFTATAARETSISASDSGGATPDDFCELDPATEYAAYVAAEGTESSLPTGMTRHVSTPVQKDGVVSSVASYDAAYTATVDAFISAVSGLSTTTTFGYVLETFETRAAGSFAGTGTGYTAAAGTSVAGQSGSLAAGDASGTLVIDDRMDIKLFNIGSSFTGGGDLPGNDPGIANNTGNDADRGYNQTEDGDLYLEVLPADQRAGGVLVCFEELGSAVYGFGFHLMGREEDKRDVYLDVHLSDGTIYRELTGTNPNGTGGEQFYSFTIAPSGGKTIEGFALYESWAAIDNADRRDIFAIDDLALVVADKADALTSSDYRQATLGRNDSGGGGADTAPPSLQSAIVSTDGRTITLTFSEALDIAAPTLSQMPARFTVTAGLASNWPIESVSISGNVVVLTTPDYAPIPRPANLNPSTVTVGYTDYTPGNDATEVLQDYPAGNDVATFSGFAAQNNSTYTPGGPTLPNVQTVEGAFTVTEGQGNTYMVTLDAPTPAGGMTLAWRVTPATSGASASPEDFQNTSPGQMPSGELYFGAGSTQASVTVSTVDDIAEEPAEGFFFKVGKVDAAQVFQPIAGAEVYTVIYESDQGGDKQAPDLSIGASTQKILAGDYVSVYFSFTEPVTGFDLSDVTVTGGTLSNLYKSPSGDFYNAQFLPTSFDGTSTFSVAAGRYADAAGNLNTLASTLSVPTFTVQPGNSGSTTLNGNQVIISFSEVITPTTPSGDPLSSSGFYLALNPTADNSFEGGSQPPQITGVALDVTGKVLTLTASASFLATDVVRVKIEPWNAQFRDADGNRLAQQEIYIGGSGANTIDLEWYYGAGSTRQILRGNGGDDTLIGTDGADSFVDGGGVDFIDPLFGGDSISLIENGGNAPYGRDTIMVGIGESRRGVGNTDVFRFDPANDASGFDWFSPTASAHDVLKLESGVIGSSSSFLAAPAAQGAITSHSIAAGVVTFRNSAGAEVAITQATNLGNALDYLRFNLQAAGHTVAFKADYDNNGTAESLFVYQDMGTLPLAGNAEMPDIVVRIEQPGTTAAGRLAAVTLGNTEGANVLQIVDGFTPEPLAVGLTSTGVTLNFAEPVFAPSTVGNLAMTLQVNATGAVYTPASVTGAGTAVITVQAAGLTLSPTDWALVSYGGTDLLNALRDAAGNLLRAEDDEGNAVTHRSILGSSGNNNINLSAFQVNGRGMDIEAQGGNDTVIGTALEDWIDAGTGADAITGGGGGDAFYFEQGDSPVATVDRSAVGPNSYMLEGARYAFSGGVEVVTDLAAGDQVIIAPLFEGLINGSGWLTGVSASQTSETGSMTGAGATGQVPDQRFMGLQGTLGTDGVFTVGPYDNSPDTLVLYDGDNAIGTALTTGFVLKGVKLNDLEGLYGGDSLRLRAAYPINGTPGNDTIYGTESADSINGLAGDDFLEGRGGNDSLSGGEGNDYLIGGSGNDTLDGGTQGDFGSDVAAYWLGGYTSPVSFTSTWRTAGGQQADGTGGTDTLINIEELHFGGGMANDVLVGDSGRNYIQGEGGNDSITGGGGNDTFAFSFGQYHGPQGNDTITDFTGDDQLLFNNFSITSVTVGASTGTLMAGAVSVVVDTDRTVLHVGADTVPGADLTITLLGGFQGTGFRSNLVNYGGATNSEIRYAAGQVYTGTSGNDSYNGGEGNDTLSGAGGNDSLSGFGGDDGLKGEAGNDQLRGDDGNDTLEGGDGNDYMTGGPGNDSLVGGAGTDTADYYFQGNPTGSLGPVTVDLTAGSASGGQGNDTLSGIENVNGTDGDDLIRGDGANNSLEGRGGNDTLKGEAGDDYFTGGLGADLLEGGGGLDTSNYSDVASAVQVDLTLGTAQGGGGSDTLVSIELAFGSPYGDLLKGGNPANGSGATDGFEGYRGNAGNDTIDGGAGFDRAQYDNSPYAVQVTLGGSSPGSARDGWRSNTSDPASDGTDTLINIEEVRASAYNDTLTGSDEAGRYESFEGRAGNDTINGRGGTDRASYQTSPNAVSVNLGLGTARDGWRSTSSDPASDGTDTLTGIEEVRGSDHNDTIVGSAGDNWLEGRSGNDSLAGGAGGDTLFGEAGSDTLDGGDGDDRVTYRSSTAGIVVDLTKTTGQVQDGLGGVDTVISIEGFSGSSHGDQFLGPVVAMPYLYIEGAGGADTIDGGTAAGVREVGFTFETTGVTARLSGWVGSNGALPTGYTGSARDGSGAIDVLRNIQNLEGSNHNDALYGDANDNNIDGRGGADTIDGGDGRDTIEFNQAKADIHVDLSQNLVLDDGQVVGSAAAGAAVEQDTLVSIENVDGGGFNDLIVGSGVENFLQGRGGVDTLNGGGGDDTLQGGSGDDTLDGGAGVDTAAFTGAFADYTVLIEATGIKITDTVANRDGIDRVMNVERFLFSDGEYRVSGSGAGLAALNPQAAEVLDLTQGSGYTDAVDASTFQFTDSNIGDWIDGFPPLLISQVSTRTLATIVGDGDDNELKYGTEFIAGAAGTPGTTQVFFRYDMDAALGQVQPSDLIELSFPGDVRANLVPESLTYSG